MICGMSSEAIRGSSTYENPKLEAPSGRKTILGGKNSLKPLHEPPQIDPEDLLEPILDQCSIKARSRTPPKQPRSGQECPKEPPDRPKPLPNRAQDSPRSNFEAIFWRVFSCWKFASFFNRFIVVFSLLEPLILMLPSRRNANFHKIAFFEKHATNRRKTLPKPFQNLPKSTQN